MIKLAFFTGNRKVIKFTIENKVITYFDDMWKKGIQLMPLDKVLIERLKNGKMNLRMMAALILDTNKGENLKQYEQCKTDEDIATMIRKDCKEKALLEVK